MDTGSHEELQQKKFRLTEILNLLKEKERNETPLIWGKSSTKIADSTLKNQLEANKTSELDGGKSIA